jgi:hypothetical protein
VVFALVYHFTHHTVAGILYGGAREGVANQCPTGKTYDKTTHKCK